MILTRPTGRLYLPDARDRLYSLSPFVMRNILPAPTVRKLPWHLGELLHQNGFNECVIYCFQHFYEAAPRVRELFWDTAIKHLYYDRARERDGFPMPHDGTTARAICSIAKEEDIIEGYFWVHDTETAIEYLRSRGPLMQGTEWFPSMSSPNKYGYVDVEGINPSYIGHEYLSTWYYPPSHKMYPDTFVFRNSWGRWGKWHNGKFLMKRDTFEYLMWQCNGDLVLPVEKYK